MANYIRSHLSKETRVLNLAKPEKSLTFIRGNASEDGDVIERSDMIPIAKDGGPDFDNAPPDMRLDYGEFSQAAGWWNKETQYRASPRCVEYLAPVEGEEKQIIGYRWKWLCGGLVPRAAVRDERGENHGIFAYLKDTNGEERKLSIPREIPGSTPVELAGLLSSNGLSYSPKSAIKQRLCEYLHNAKLRDVWRCVDRVGWYADSFVFPDETLTPDEGETVIFQSSNGRSVGDALRSSGTLHDWQQQVAAPLSGNHRGVFSLAAALSAPLLDLTDMEGGGFHFRGGSSGGKTTLLQIAGSVWGGGARPYVQTWRATDNGLEAAAQAHNSLLLCLDELAQVEAGAAGKVAYMLANGAGKTRAGRTGTARAPATWRLLFLSTGEISLSDKMREDSRGPKTMAGQDTRLADIPADAGADMGVWNVTPEGMTPGQFSDALKVATAQTYGTAGRAFVQYLVNNRDEARVVTESAVSEFVKSLNLVTEEGQVLRVARRFGLVAAAGELAIGWGILPYQAGEAIKACKALFNDWRNARGGDENSEQRQHVEAIRSFIEKHGASRFERLDGASFDGGVDQKVINRAGWKRTDDEGHTEYLFHKAGWLEACEGLDAKAVRQTLADLNHLMLPATGRHLTCSIRVPGNGMTRLTVVLGEIGSGE